MTNAEKYLKDEVSVEEIITTMEKELPFSYVDLAQFWGKTIKPKLTEGEKVILRHLNKKYIFIGKKDKILYISNKKKEEGDYFAEKIIGLDIIFPYLFQFIQNGEEYEIAELLKGE